MPTSNVLHTTTMTPIVKMQKMKSQKWKKNEKPKMVEVNTYFSRDAMLQKCATLGGKAQMAIRMKVLPPPTPKI